MITPWPQAGIYTDIALPNSIYSVNIYPYILYIIYIYYILYIYFIYIYVSYKYVVYIYIYIYKGKILKKKNLSSKLPPFSERKRQSCIYYSKLFVEVYIYSKKCYNVNRWPLNPENKKWAPISETVADRTKTLGSSPLRESIKREKYNKFR